MITETEVERIDYGWYLLNPGETPQQVAQVVYGDVSKAGFLLQINNVQWSDLTHVRVPNRAGRVTHVRADDTPVTIIQRMFPGQLTHLFLPALFKWNGGNREYETGELVFIPER